MTSWIYVFSKFTPEALLFEALVICLLMAAYAAYWILRKRKLGAVDQEIPSSIVKVYLNELIGEAQDMRTQLFGLLSGGTVSASELSKIHASAPLALELNKGQDLSAIEAKLTEQAKAIEKILTEKTKLEKELAEARAGAGATAASGTPTAAPEEVQKLQDKCQVLEARLAEYSVIEDDLANLKRLQQENAQLKAQLGGVSGNLGATPAETQLSQEATPGNQTATSEAGVELAAANETPASEAPTTEKDANPEVKQGEAPLEEAGISAAPEAAATAESATPPTTAADEKESEAPAAQAQGSADGPEPAAAQKGGAVESATKDPNFEGLVDEVEKSLQPSSVGETTPPQLSPATPDASPNKSAGAALEKSDEDLIAEFEKMLNS